MRIAEKMATSNEVLLFWHLMKKRELFELIMAKRKKKNVFGKGNFISHESLIKIFARKKKMRFVTMLLAQTNRIRVTWMSPCTDAWFTMADASLDDQEWYKNFSVKKNISVHARTHRGQNTPPRYTITCFCVY